MFIDKFSVSGEDFYLKLNYFCGDPFMNWQVSRAHGILPLVQAIVRDGGDRQNLPEESEPWVSEPVLSSGTTFRVPRSPILLMSAHINQPACLLFHTYACLLHSTNLSVISYLLIPAHINQPACSPFHTYSCPLHSTNLSFQTHWRKPDQTLIFFSRVL